MIWLRVADLVVIGARALEADTEAVLDGLDVAAAEAALAEARRPPGERGPAPAAAALLHGLLRHRPLAEGNEQVAVLATAQFLLLNGFEVRLDPPADVQEVVGRVVAGRLGAAGLADWLAGRVSPRVDVLASCAGRRPFLRWLPGRRSRRGQDRFHRYTDRARTVVVLAQDEARGLGHNYIGTEHILLGLIGEADGVAAKALRARGIGLGAVRDRIEEIVGCGEGAPAGHVPFTPRAKRVLLECALREAMQLGHGYVGTEHLLLGLLREGNGLAAEVLTSLGAHHATTREQVIGLLHGSPRDGHGERPPAPPNDLRDPPASRDIDVVALVEEARGLRAEVDRLRALARRHGIDPDGDDGQGRVAQAGR